jgi:alcohol dehydrogenase
MADPFTYTSFDVLPKTRLIFGNNSLDRIGELAKDLGCQRALLVTDRGILAAGHVDRACAHLKAAGLQVAVYADVRENPTTLDVDCCLQIARSHPIDLFIGFGGGSSMDTAKGTNFLLSNGGEMRDYWGVGKAKKPMLPLIAIPTTAGTGSECQSAALIADEVTHQKMACLDPKAAAAIAVLDPELTVSQPPRVTAVTGVDALAHALETAVTRRKTPYSRIFSQEAFRLCSRALPKVVSHPQDLVARGEMLLGAAYAGMAIESSMLGAAHAAANPLTAHFGVVHGEAVGLMLPAVIRLNATDPECCEIYAELARAAGWAGSQIRADMACARLLDQLNVVLDQAGIAGRLENAAVDFVQGPGLEVLAGEAAKQWTATFNPVPVGPAEFEQLYASVVMGRSKPLTPTPQV